MFKRVLLSIFTFYFLLLPNLTVFAEVGFRGVDESSSTLFEDEFNERVEEENREDGREIREEDLDFEIQDAQTDVAYFPDGRKAYRIYPRPRPVYETAEGLKLRSPEWSRFFSDERTRLKEDSGNYTYSAPLEDVSIEVKGGIMQEPSGKFYYPQTNHVLQERAENAFETTFTEIYPGIDAKFEDDTWNRKKSYIIKTQPIGLNSGEELIIWEDYTLPAGARITTSADEEREIESYVRLEDAETVYINYGEEKFAIGSAVIFDANGEEATGQGLVQHVSIDAAQGVLKIGLEVPTDFLLNSQTTYPVVVDPDYCLSGCNTDDFYVTTKNGNKYYNNWVNDKDLIAGVYKYGSNYFGRHSVIRFNKNFTTITEDIDKAKLKLRFRNKGLGTGNGATMAVKRISGDWKATESYTNYSFFRKNLVNENSSKYISTSSIGDDISLDISNTVKSWQSNDSTNKGLLIEPPGNWSSGSKPPNSWVGLTVIFDSTDTSNNPSTDPYIYIETKKVTKKEPDLKMSKFYAKKFSYYPGDEAKLVSVVENDGNGDAGSFRIGYYLSKSSSFSKSNSTYLGYDKVSYLDAGYDEDNTEYVTIPSNISPGTWYFHAVADYKDDVSESNENNNVDSDKVTIKAKVTPKAELFTNQPGLSNTNPEQGSSVTVTSVVYNTGNKTAYNFKLNYYISPNSNFNSANYSNFQTISSLSGGSNTSTSRSIYIPENLTPDQDYYLFTKVDPDNSVSESNEGNNVSLYSKFTVKKKTQANPKYPDLDYQVLAINFAEFVQGETLQGRMRVVNKGLSTSPATTVQVKLGSNVIANVNIPSLAVGETDIQRYFNYQIPSSLAAGQYKLSFQIDPSDSIKESNEGNNYDSGTITIKKAPEKKANLYFVDPTINGSEFKQGATVSGSFKVKNGGTADAGETTVKVKLDSSEKKSITITALAASKEDGKKSYSFTLPSNISEGKHTVTLQIDPDDSIKESNNSDNIKSWDINVTKKIVQKADLVFSNPKIDATEFKQGSTLSGKFTVKNIGNATSQAVVVEAALDGNKKATIKIPELGAGKSDEERKYSFVISSGTVTGDRKFTLTIDPDDSVKESNENNNSKSWDIKIKKSTGGTNDDDDNDGYINLLESAIGTDPNAVDLNPIYSEKAFENFAQTTDFIDNNYGGDPVNLRTGALEFIQTDFYLKTKGLPLEFKRIYNSKVIDRNGRLGTGWSHTYNQFYYQDPKTKDVLVYLDNYRALHFKTTNGGSTFTSPMGEPGILRKIGNNLVYETMDKKQYIFSKKLVNELGFLEKIKDRNGNTTTLSYTETKGIPLLNKVTGPSGRSLKFTHGTGDNWNKIIEVKDEISSTPQTIKYSYSANDELEKVVTKRIYNNKTEEITKTYTYEKGLLKTYTDPRGTKLHNEYDAKNRATKQYEYNPNTKKKITLYEYKYDASCTTLTTHQSATSYNEKTCFNGDGLKISKTDGEGNTEYWTRDVRGMANTYTDKNGNKTSYTFDSKRRLIKEILPAAPHTVTIEYTYDNVSNRITKIAEKGTSTTRTTKYTIDGKGNITSVTDALGNKESYTYDSSGLITSHTNKVGTKTNYTYDSNGNLNSATTGSTKYLYEYNAYNKLTSYTEPNGGKYSYSYDNLGNLRHVKDPLNHNEYFNYDLENHLTYYKGKAGVEVTAVYDKNFAANPTQIQKKDGSASFTTKKSYDNFGNLTKEVDANGNTTSISYNKLNLPTKVTNPIFTTYFTYDKNGNLKEEKTSQGNRTTYSYDARNNLIKENKYITANSYATTSYTYDNFGRLTQIKDPNGKSYKYTYDILDNLTTKTNALVQKTTYKYDALGRVIKETDAKSRNTSYQYDAFGRLTKQTDPDGRFTTLIYDANGTVNQIIERHTANLGDSSRRTFFTYDKLNRLIQKRDAMNGSEYYSYLADGRLKSYTDKMGRKTQVNHTNLKQFKVVAPGGEATTYKLDNNGNLVSITDPLNNTTTYSYDALNRPTQITDALNGKKKFTYNALGNTLSQIDELGNATNYAYDLLGRLTQETNAQGTKTNYSYDKNGNLTKKIDNGGNVHNYYYDALNRLVKEVSPGDIVEQYKYDQVGNLIQFTNGKGNQRFYTYDILDRLTAEGFQEINQILYTYDPWGNITKVKDHAGTVTFFYDYRNLPLIETRKFKDLKETYKIYRVFDKDGRITDIKDPLGVGTKYSRDVNGRIDKISTSNGKELVGFNYDKNGRPTKIQLGTYMADSYKYDALGRITNIKVNDNNKVTLRELEYGYDSASNLKTEKDNTYDSDSKLMRSENMAYTYDKLSQLTGWKMNSEFPITMSGEQNYKYDPLGNRTETFGGHNAAKYKVSNERLIQEVNGLGTSTLTYDKNGDLVKEVMKDNDTKKEIENTKYTYNSRGHLTNIERKDAHKDGTKTTEAYFVYDYLGNRVKKVVNGKTTYYINDSLNQGHTVLNEIQSNGKVTKSLVHGPTGLLAEVIGEDKIRYIHKDRQGSTVMLTNGGAILSKYYYDAYGEPHVFYEIPDYVAVTAKTVYDGEKTTNYLYTGQEYDVETGLYYYNARYYDPTKGSFISKDPMRGYLGDLLSRNRYTYVKNNPFKYTDPSGNSAITMVDDFIKGAVKTGAKTGGKKVMGKIPFIGPFIEFVSDIPVIEDNGVVLRPADAPYGPVHIDDYVPFAEATAEDFAANGWDYNPNAPSEPIQEAEAKTGTGTQVTTAMPGGNNSNNEENPSEGESAYEIAKSGGRHYGTYKNYVNRSADEILSAIKGYQKQISTHLDKIKNPSKYVKNWDELSRIDQLNLLKKKWPKDIKRNMELRDIMIGILENMLK